MTLPIIEKHSTNRLFPQGVLRFSFRCAAGLELETRTFCRENVNIPIWQRVTRPMTSPSSPSTHAASLEASEEFALE